MTIELLLPLATPSQNEFHYGTHWTKARENKAMMARALLMAIGGSGQQAEMKARGKRRLSIIRFGKRRLDLPNLVGGCKGVIDCLVGYGLLVDDDDRHLELGRIENGKLAKGQAPHTRLILEECS